MKRIVFLIVAVLFSFASKAQSVTYTCRYWFDTNYGQAITSSFSTSTWQSELDVGELSTGLHTLHIMASDTSSVLSATMSYMFLKMSPEESLLDSVDMSNLICHSWFDQDYTNKQTRPLGNGNFLLDVSNLDDGLHTLNVMLEGSTLTSVESYMFIKVAQQEPLIQPINMNDLVYHCWYDQDYENRVTAPISNGVILLDVDNVGDGLHSVHILLEGEALTSTLTYMFLKKPEHQDYGIAKWQYFLNGDVSQIHTTEVSPVIDTLDIITLLPVETWPVRSSCFHFHPNGDEPYLNAKNEITFRFWSNDDRMLDKSAFYIDYQVQQDIVASVFERNTTETFTAPRNNQIQWFKLDAGRGDSLAFKANKACTMQLFAPSGEEVYSATASEAMTIGGCHAWEDGTYYLAVHDQTGSGDELSVTYNWVYRYAILAYDVHLVGNGGCSTITFNGNGYNSLLDVYMVNAQNDTIHRLDIGHESNSTTTVTFNFYEVNLGVYDAVFHFYDEDIRINGALEVQEPVDIVLTSTVSYPSTFRRDTECVYTYTITNNGNMSAYGVPIFVYISTATMDGITHLEFDGMDLPSVIAGVNLDTLSETDCSLYRQWANQIGEDHHFIKLHSIDEETGDSIVIRSNYFCLNLAPFEEKTIKLNITANELLDVWVTTPADTIPPLFGTQNRSGSFCCVTDKIACLLDIVCGATDLASLISNLSGVPVSTALGAANCICGVLQTGNTVASRIYCREDGPGDFMSDLRTSLAVNSYIGTVLTCAQSLIPGGRADETVNLINKITSYINVFAHPNTVYECITSFLKKKPDCPPGDHKGGKSTPVQPCEPNEIRGYLAESGSHYMMQDIQTITYEIESENDTTATAAAHTIIVRDTLDVNKFDVSSLAAHRVTIHDKVLELNGEHNFVYTLDLRPNVYVIAQIQQECYDETGIVVWTITSLDPMTMEPTTDPNQGALPINYNGEGIATFTFNVNLKEPFPDGTEINNRVGIIFDLEEVVLTDTWTNIVDAVKPNSTIADVTQAADTLNFIFSSEDNRSGIWYHTLYYRNDSTDMEWKVKKSQILENNYKMNLEDVQMTEYFVLATDSAGNREEKDFLAEYVYGQGNVILQNNSLVQGWNWYSTYIEQNDIDGLTMLENSLGTAGIRIQGRNQYAEQFEYQGTTTWYGTLNAIINEQMYKVRTNAACNAVITGIPANPANHPITINSGWNWIGLPLSQNTSVGTALNGFTPADGDVLKGRNASTTYIANYGWYGTLNTLEPGKGYMYKSNSSTAKQLTFQSGRGKVVKTNLTCENNNYIPEISKFSDNMLVTAVVDLNGEELRSEDYELAAFVNDECRGSVKLMYVEPLDRYEAFLLVFGDESEDISFALTDGTETRWSGDNIVYASDALIGTASSPATIHFGVLSMDDNMMTSAKVYPNPVSRDTEISISIPQNETIKDIVITNVIGETIRREIPAGTTIKGITNAGVYMLQVICESGNVYKSKVVVK